MWILNPGQGWGVRRVPKPRRQGQVRRVLEELRELHTGPAAQLMLNEHCPYCAFHQRCHAEAMAKDDLSLLRGLSAKDITQHHKHGIFTVTQLSCTFRPRKRRKPAPPKPPLHQAALQALA